MQATTDIPFSASRTRNPSSEHRFYVGTAIVALIIAVVAFVPGIVDPASRRGPITPLVALHGALFSGWLVLYLVQSVLVATGNRRLHRRLGVLGGGLAIAMIVSAYQTSIDTVRRGFDLSGDLDRLGPVILQTSFQLSYPAVFGALVVAALLNRRRPDVHKRLMWLTIPPLMGAPVVHVVGHFGLPRVIVPLATLTLFAVGPLYDRIVVGRMHPVTLWGGVMMFLFANFLALVMSPNPTWQRFVLWLAS